MAGRSRIGGAASDLSFDDVVIPRVAIVCSSLAMSGIAAADEGTDTVAILNGFTPERAELTPLNVHQIEAAFAGKKHMGLYRRTNRPDQRYTEVTGEDKRLEYREGSERFWTGTWKADRGRMCFTYTEGTDIVTPRSNCQYIYRYGDCFVGYSEHRPRNVAGKPLEIDLWVAVHKITSMEFEWPDVPASETKPFTCRMLSS